MVDAQAQELTACNVKGGSRLELRIQQNPGRGKLGVKFESLEPVGLPRVKAITAGLAMSSIGAKEGDVLLTVNGVVANHSNLTTLLNYPLRLEILRGGVVEELTQAAEEPSVADQKSWRPTKQEREAQVHDM